MSIVSEITSRDWRPMATAPKDRVINVVARYIGATAGAPTYAGWSEYDGVEGWYVFSRNAPQLVIPWAWRERDAWPSKPPLYVVDQLRAKPDPDLRAATEAGYASVNEYVAVTSATGFDSRDDSKATDYLSCLGDPS